MLLSSMLYRSPCCSVLLRTSSRLSLQSRSLSDFSKLKGTTLGILREDPARTWERRSPLDPNTVRELVGKGVKVSVESSQKRCFADGEFEEAGASITPSLPLGTSVILGIKEHTAPFPNPSSPASTYAFFSHTHKGQSYNLPLLQRMLESQARFVDWELLTAPSTTEDGKTTFERTTAFGYLAGFSGMSDALSLLGIKLLASSGRATPLLSLSRPFRYPTIKVLKEALSRVGTEWIGEKKGKGEREVLSVVINGRGRVGKGAKDVLDALGCVQWCSMRDLRKYVSGDKKANPTKIYACQLELSDYLVAKDGTPFNREHYRSHPADFESVFASKVAPYTTMFLNGGFWSKGCPRIMSTEDLAKLQRREGGNKLLSIVDVSCDWEGALEFITKATTIDDPTYQFDATSGTEYRDPAHPHTTQISAIEIHPSQLAKDASIHFSSSIKPYVLSLLTNPSSTSDSTHGKAEEYAQALRRASVVYDGKLGEGYQDLDVLLQGLSNQNGAVPPEEGHRRKKVLMLGSGLVAGPAVEVLAARKDLDLVIASNSLEAATILAGSHENVSATFLDAGDKLNLESLISEADVVLSLLPAPLHFGVAKICIEKGASLVTASYVSKEMMGLHESAKTAGVVLLNELGLDPGIDHCSAMRLIEEARSTGNEITSFVSFCGGLPAPEDSNGLLGYKFSWSPRGVLTAALNSARFRLNGREINIAGKDLLEKTFDSVPIIRGFKFQGVANRDSVTYLKEYGLQESLPTIIRGTLRYEDFIPVVATFKMMGLMELESMESIPESWSDFGELCLRKSGVNLNSLLDDSPDGGMIRKTLEDLSLLPSQHARGNLPSLPDTPHSPIDLLSILLSSELAYFGAERDAVILKHEVVTTSSTGISEVFESSLVQYGVPGAASAMASTVGIPIAVGALLCLDSRISQRGVVSPSHEEVWRPLLTELDARGVRLVEKRTVGSRGVLAALEAQAKDCHASASALSASSVASTSVASELQRQGVAPSQISRSAASAGDRALASATSVSASASSAFDSYTSQASKSALSVYSHGFSSLSSLSSVAARSATSASAEASASVASAMKRAGYATEQISKSAASAGLRAQQSASSLSANAGSNFDSFTKAASASASSAAVVAQSSLSSAYSVASKSVASASYHASKSASASLKSAGVDPSAISKSASSAGVAASKSAESVASSASSVYGAYTIAASKSAVAAASSVSSLYSVASKSAASGASEVSKSAYRSATKDGLDAKHAAATASSISRDAQSSLSLASKSASSSMSSISKSASAQIHAEL